MSTDHESSVGQDVGEEAEAPKWQALNRNQRRVLGVLIEKAKTTPDSYPLSLNGLTTGANQKSNRSPLMNMSADDAEEALDALRGMGAVAEVQGGGRVAKYRHYAKDWFSVSGKELAVIAELLLRGSQTVGELRGRAARMEPIKDMAELQPILDGLVAKELILELTPKGRGQMVTHNLFEPHEMDRVLESAQQAASSAATAAPSKPPAAPAAPRSPATSDGLQKRVDDLERLTRQLSERIADLEARIPGQN